jgi:hypothetical protein
VWAGTVVNPVPERVPPNAYYLGVVNNFREVLFPRSLQAPPRKPQAETGRKGRSQKMKDN